MYNVDPSVANFDLEKAMEEVRVIREINELTQVIGDAAVAKTPSFSVLFSALANATAAFTFDYLVARGSPVNNETVQEGIQLFVDALCNMALERLKGYPTDGEGGEDANANTANSDL